ncbi:MAG: hypothetical protein ACYSSL_09410 [Planctomycetota bacterium]|jgi:hypothetical protein
MDSFWVKMGVFAVIVAGLVYLVTKSPAPTIKDEKETTKGFSEVVREDQERLRAELVPEEGPKANETAVKKGAEEAAVKAPMPKPAKKEFKELSETEQIEAERLLEVAINGRSMGRLPGVGFKLMVDTCREIIRKFGGSSYEYRARRMLGEVPERFWPTYKITKEEVEPEK